ncbi:MAG: DUF1848 domain-containing protein [Ruminococcaceae bacterium]|nr:DUF1848 domain-containing protein [Oscillospiraceae bacterium]
MIISASRRTDIPTYYSEWFFNRLKAGYVYVRNPMHAHRISKISLSPSVVDGIVFWTKNPIPMTAHLDKLDEYAFYFQFTLNAYGTDIEPGVPGKNDVLIPAFRELSERIGAERVIWRYDPIMLTAKYTAEYHVKYFGELVKRLAGYTHTCVISFIDFYRNTRTQLRDFDMLPLDESCMYELAECLAEIARENGLKLESCAETVHLEQFGIQHGHCVDRMRFEKILHCKLKLSADKNQRAACGCVESIDIGAYNTCRNGCRYCYANYIPSVVSRNAEAHNPASPLLFGEVSSEDIISERKMVSLKEDQLNIL